LNPEAGMSLRPRLLALAITAAFAVSPAVLFAGPPKPEVPPDPAIALAHEQAGQWDKALDVYLKLYLADPSLHGDLREKIRECLRHTAQLRRHHDPAFQQYVLSLPLADALNLYAEVVLQLTTRYADKDRATPAKLFALGAEELERAFAGPTFRDTFLPDVSDTKIAKFLAELRTTHKVRLPENPKESRQAVREVVATAESTLGLKNGSSFVLEFLCGACAGLDEFTQYVSPGTAAGEWAGPVAEFASYGVLVEFRDRQLLVWGVVPESWAALNTPLHKGDRIVRVNGKDLVEATPAKLADALRTPGANGHELEIAIPVPDLAGNVTLPLPAPTVYGDAMLKDGVGYVKIAAFREGTLRELEGKLMTLQARGMRALVLDLRGNPGGLFTEAILVAQRFLPVGIVASTQGQSPDVANRVFSSDSGMTALDVPLVVLVDVRTMSAAEVLAGALKDHNRATLVGMPTFGKGALQSRIRLPSTDGPTTPAGTLILTVAHVFSPTGAPLAAGVLPHLLEPDPQKQLDAAVARATELAGPPTMMPPMTGR
jgi:carboxyl-terminal processing protease